jgi:hypothetical protein
MKKKAVKGSLRSPNSLMFILIVGGCMKKLRSFMPIFLVSVLMLMFTAVCYAQGTDPTAVSDPWAMVMNILTPALSFGAVWIFKNWLAPNVPGVIVVALIVPIASGLIALITYFIGVPGVSFVWQFVLGILSNFISQIIVQAKNYQAGNP